jgi:hypothetical protein
MNEGASIIFNRGVDRWASRFLDRSRFLPVSFAGLVHIHRDFFRGGEPDPVWTVEGFNPRAYF